jgi:hypothetical protein
MGLVKGLLFPVASHLSVRPFCLLTSKQKTAIVGSQMLLQTIKHSTDNNVTIT